MSVSIVVRHRRIMDIFYFKTPETLQFQRQLRQYVLSLLASKINHARLEKGDLQKSTQLNVVMYSSIVCHEI